MDQPLPTADLDLLQSLYGGAVGASTYRRLQALVDRYRSRIPRPRATGLSHKDAVLITYPDQVREHGVPPLRSLAHFCERHLSGLVSTVHILPFFPSSSDDGFSVVDYRRVDHGLGDWRDVRRIGRTFRLMFDAVVNHASVRGKWFGGFLRRDPRLKDFFIAVEGDPDLSQAVRPRVHPLLTEFVTASGKKRVWTTFSPDQADLNYRNPLVLLKIVDILLFYVARGAEFLRLDAVAFLWKEAGTPCLHLPQTHRIVQLIRAVLNRVAPHVMLITETNVPHEENITYFGDGTNEAQLVYNFALPPLVLHAFVREDAWRLSRWAAGLALPSDRAAYLNFLASHDGIGLNPVKGLLPQGEIDSLVAHTQSVGGLVSHKQNPDGTTSPYELNINYLDALGTPGVAEDLAQQVERFVTAQAIMLALAGVPALYFHSLFGSRGWPQGARQMGNKRAINREKCALQEVEADLAAVGSLRSQIFGRCRALLEARRSSPAFHPLGPQQVVDCGRAVFAVLRRAVDDGDRLLCLHNVSGAKQRVEVDFAPFLGASGQAPTSLTRRTGRSGSGDLAGRALTDRITRRAVAFQDGKRLELRPYETLWLG